MRVRGARSSFVLFATLAPGFFHSCREVEVEKPHIVEKIVEVEVERVVTQEVIKEVQADLVSWPPFPSLKASSPPETRSFPANICTLQMPWLHPSQARLPGSHVTPCHLIVTDPTHVLALFSHKI